MDPAKFLTLDRVMNPNSSRGELTVKFILTVALCVSLIVRFKRHKLILIYS